MAKAKIKRGIPVMLKKGGAHRRSKSSERRKAKNELRREVRALRDGRESSSYFLFISMFQKLEFRYY